MRKRWLLSLPALLVVRAVRVRLSVGPRRRYWQAQGGSGDLTLVALGDSLTQGIGSARPGTSWLGLFCSTLEQQSGGSWRVDNRAAYGARIADLIAYQLPVPDDADLVTVCIGANDAGRTSPATFRSALFEVCRQLPPGSIVGDVPEFVWGSRIPAAAELARIVRDVVAEFPALRLAEVEKHTAGLRIATELAGDFFHPGDRGHRRIGEAFVLALAPMHRPHG